MNKYMKHALQSALKDKFPTDSVVHITSKLTNAKEGKVLKVNHPFIKVQVDEFIFNFYEHEIKSMNEFKRGKNEK